MDLDLEWTGSVVTGSGSLVHWIWVWGAFDLGVAGSGSGALDLGALGLTLRGTESGGEWIWMCVALDLDLRGTGSGGSAWTAMVV